MSWLCLLRHILVHARSHALRTFVQTNISSCVELGLGSRLELELRLGLGLRPELGLGFAVGDVLRDRPHSCD